MNRAEVFAGVEREHPAAVLAVWPTELAGDGPISVPRVIARQLGSSIRPWSIN